MSTYGDSSDRFTLTYTDIAGTKTGQDSTGEFYTITASRVDDTQRPQEVYSITSIYQDTWGIGFHRFIGTVDSRKPDVFVSQGDGGENASSDGSFKSGTTSQVSYFSTPEGLALIRNKGKEATLNDLRENFRNKNKDWTDQQVEAEAQAAANQIFSDTSTAIGGDQRSLDDGVVLKPIERATERDELAGKPGTHLVYPQDHAQGDFDFIKLVPIEYVPQLQGNRRVEWNSLVNVKQRYRRRERVVGATMFLPMVPGIVESNAVEWGGDSLNPVQMAAANLAMQTIAAPGGPEGKINTFMQQSREIIDQIGGNNTQIRNALTAFFAGRAVGADVLGRAGIIVNPNLEVLFTGPKLRTFTYNFNFTPRDDREAKTIRTIIKVVKKAMAPKRRPPGMFLQVPSIFKIKYLMKGTQEHPFLNKIKPCAMTGFNVDYTPDGSYMTYGDGSMTSYKVQMNLAEIEPIYNDDIEIDSDNMGY